MTKEKFYLLLLGLIGFIIIIGINLTMITWSKTRRSGEELGQIKMANYYLSNKCKGDGGKPITGDYGNFVECNFNHN
jgi:hypothetical protein